MQVHVTDDSMLICCGNTIKDGIGCFNAVHSIFKGIDLPCSKGE